MKTRHAACCALLLFSYCAGAQANDAIATDRPDFVESSQVVGAGRFQFEAGLSVERSGAGGDRLRTRSTPLLLRFGLASDWELRLETDGSIAQRGGGQGSVKGQADLALGAKWHVQDGEGARPSMALLVHVDLATGSRSQRGDGARPSLRLVAEWELEHGFSLGLMPGILVDRNEAGKRYSAGILGLVIGKSVTERLRGFAELAAARMTSSANGGTDLNFNLGAAYLLTPSVQLDLALSRGLNRFTADQALNLGLSAKF